MIKRWQKVSGFPRALAGAGQFCAIRRYLSTAKHASCFFNALALLAEGSPGARTKRDHSRCRAVR